MPVVTSAEWETFLAAHPNAHLLQTRAWGELKLNFGWQVGRVITSGSPPVGAQVLFRRFLPGLAFAYIPKGPVSCGGPESQPEEEKQRWGDLWPEVDALCRQKGCVFLKVEPDMWTHQDGNREVAPPSGFVSSPHPIQPPRTLVVDLHGDEDEILGRMKQKTRYNIRLALKKGIVVRPSANLELFHTLAQVTGERDAFGVHSSHYYQWAYELFHPTDACELLLAEFEHQPLAAILVFSHGQRAWYFYGASSNEHRERMPNYLLQWEAMRWARARGCTQYNLWGVPDMDESTLEEEFTQRSEGLWGVYRFKRGFGGRLRRSSDPWDRVYRPWLYQIYRWRMSQGAADQV